ncbi:MAG: hypothetical protein MRY32_05645 [Rickettsiales bacterium]|nr:hypothetical protein [Rickettsiales bacterium]
MFSLLRKPDIPFSREDANRFLPWVIGLMVCLVGLFLAIAISIGTASHAVSSLNINHFQVYIPYQAEGLEKRVEVVKAVMDTFSAVEDVRQVRAEDMANLIEPWTGSMLELKDLPLPAVLEATLKEGLDRENHMKNIRSKLRKLDEGIEVEQYDEWIQQLWRFTDALRMLALTLAGLLLVGLIIMVILTARTSLKLHFTSVMLLHHVGAHDNYIVQQFTTNGVWMVLRGALFGAILSIVITVALSMLSEGLQSPLVPKLEIETMHIIMFFFLPVVTAFVAFVTVKSTVQAMLDTMH